ncbi:MAG: lipoate--protein ligase family protein, partial [Clostridia bacterium]
MEQAFSVPREPARLIEVGADATAQAMRLSPVLTETVALSAVDRNTVTIILRRHRPYVLLGPQDRRLPHLERVRQWADAHRRPAFIRIGGGSLVLQDEGTLSFGVARPCRDLTTLERNFRELGEGVFQGLRQMGVHARYGRAAGSYCEGPWDMVVDGVKVAGVAQAIRRGFALVSG